MIDARRFSDDAHAIEMPLDPPEPDPLNRCLTCWAFVAVDLVRDPNVPDVLYWERGVCSRCVKRTSNPQWIVHYTTIDDQDYVRVLCGLTVPSWRAGSWIDSDERNPFRVTCKKCLRAYERASR